MQELTNLLQSLSATLEFGHRLQYDHHYQKLALDEELKRMEEMARANQLIEIAAIQPVLDQIIADQSVINVTRARAQRLLRARRRALTGSYAMPRPSTRAFSALRERSDNTVFGASAALIVTTWGTSFSAGGVDRVSQR